GTVGCDGTWTIVPDTGDPNTASRYRFVPPLGEGTLQLPTGTTCVVTYTATTRRVPTTDVNAGAPNVQTNQVASSTATGPTIPPPGVRNSRTDQTTVTQATPTITIGSTASDTATLSGGFNPTGTITFTAFGPNNPTCTGAPVYTSAPVTVAGNGNYTSTPPFTPPAPGSYNWVASYSGDANNTPA